MARELNIEPIREMLRACPDDNIPPMLHLIADAMWARADSGGASMDCVVQKKKMAAELHDLARRYMLELLG